MMARDATRSALISDVRASIDAGPLDHACSYHAALPFEDAREAWLQSWCAWHTQRWQELLDVSGRALDYVELSGQGRRAIELRLMRAHAAQRLQLHDLHRAELDAAQQWLIMTRELLPAPIDDVFPGDLPFLLAVHVGRGEDLRLAASKAPQDVGRLFDAASHDYMRHQSPGALAMSWRERGGVMLEAGNVSGSAEWVQRALLLDLDQGNETALTRDLEIVASMADSLGRPTLGIEVLDHLFDQGRLDAPGQLTASELPGSLEALTALGRYSEGRRQLLLWLRTTRRTESARLVKARLLALYGQVESIEQSFSPWSYELVAQIGQAFAERGERDLAIHYLASAVTMLEGVRHKLGSLHVRQEFLRAWWPRYMALVHQQVGIDTDRLPQRDYQEAAGLIGALKARGLRDLLEGRSLTPYIKTREVDALAALPPMLSGARRVLFEHVLHALAMWQITPGRTLTARPGYPLDVSRADYSAARLGELVPTGSVALEYVLGERSGYVIVVGDDGRMAMRQTAGRKEVEPLFDAFKTTLLDPEFTPEKARVHRELAERLYVALLAPVQDLIVDHERLYIAPDAMLHDLPFEALAHPSTGAAPDYMFGSHTISYMPSLHVWGLLSERDRSVAAGSSGSALLVGAPTLDQPSLDLLTLARDVPGDGLHTMSELFAELPGSAKELDAIAGALRPHGFTVQTLSGEHATEQALRTQHGKSHALIHIATHGLSDAYPWNAELERSLGMQEPALLLGQQGVHDGLWRLEEVLAFESRARLVVLSGCTTGRGWRALGDGAYGLAGAFLFAGNQSVVASSWSVSDDATRTLMSHMYAHLDAHMDAAMALNQGRRVWFAHAQKRGQTLPPFHWAAFRVLGQ